eukprot:scaffold382_cov380-Prasinococcus_capsulatus_cf.AAC.8
MPSGTPPPARAVRRRSVPAPAARANGRRPTGERWGPAPHPHAGSCRHTLAGVGLRPRDGDGRDPFATRAMALAHAAGTATGAVFLSPT